MIAVLQLDARPENESQPFSPDGRLYPVVVRGAWAIFP
jgi:hypothetical protein